MTEAACLLQSGTLYRRRIGLREQGGRLWFAGTKTGIFSLYLDDEPILHFDLEGRWQRLFRDGVHFRKSLDTSVDRLDRIREDNSLVLRRRTLDFVEATDLDAWARDRAIELAELLGAGSLEVQTPPDGIVPLSLRDLTEQLDQVIAWETTAWHAQRERFVECYGATHPDVPPDAHQSVVLQVTQPSNTTEGPVMKSLEEFEQHVLAVARFWGRRMEQARQMVLGGGDVARVPDLASYAQVARDHLPFDRFDLLIDDLRTGLPSQEAWSSLVRVGLGRVTLALGTVAGTLRRAVGQRGDPRSGIESVAAAKRAGVPVRVIVWVGLNDESTLRDTIRALDSMSLDQKDLVYAMSTSELGWDSQMADRFISMPLETSQFEAFRSAIGGAHRAHRAKVVMYSPVKDWN
jgi:hypothetical protein